MLNASRIKVGNSGEQGQLLPVYVNDLVPEDHLSRVISDVVDSLDLAVLYQKYGREGGEHFHPKSMLKIMFYGYSQGDRSSRVLMRQCQENFVYIYLGSGIAPDFRTISEFRKNNLDILKHLFKQIVKICFQLGMISIGQIFLDGTKIKANASNRNIIDKDKLTKELHGIEDQIARLVTEAEAIDTQEDAAFGKNNKGNNVPEQLEKAQDRKHEIMSLIAFLDNSDLKKKSVSDPETRFMKNHGRLDLCYNGQCATENQVILACDLDNNEDDRSSLIPMVAELNELVSELKQQDDFPLQDVKIVADSGYESGTNLQHLKEQKADGYIANQFYRIQKQEKRGEIAPRPFSKDKFSYHEQGDYYECPAGKKLLFYRETTRKKTNTTTRYYKGTSCQQCEFSSECVTSKTGFRQITRYPGYDPFREEMDKKMQTVAGKSIMRQRAMDVEPTFGQMKQSIFRQNPFLLRDKPKARGEFRLASIAHNLKKIAKHVLSINNGDYALLAAKSGAVSA